MGKVSIKRVPLKVQELKKLRDVIYKELEKNINIQIFGPIMRVELIGNGSIGINMFNDVGATADRNIQRCFIKIMIFPIFFG